MFKPFIELKAELNNDIKPLVENIDWLTIERLWNGCLTKLGIELSDKRAKKANDIIDLIIFVFNEKFENIKIIKFIFNKIIDVRAIIKVKFPKKVIWSIKNR